MTLEEFGPGARGDLRDYVGTIRRRKKTIIVCVLLVVASALVSSYLQTPVYEATAKIVLQSRSTDALFGTGGQSADPASLVQTQIEIFESTVVREEVRKKIGVDPPVSARQLGATGIIQVSAESTIPERAAAITNAYADSYIELRRTRAVNDLLAASEQIQSRIGELQKQIDKLDADVNSAPERERDAVRDSVSSEKAALVDQRLVFRQKIDQLGVDAALKDGGAELVAPATIPTSPVRPTPLRNGLLAGGVGLVLGVALAFLREYLDDSVKTKDDLHRVVPDVPVLGMIPLVQGWKPDKGAYVVSAADARSPASEAYRILRTSLQFLALDRRIHSLQVTSPGAREGKTTTIANLGITLAQTGQRVIIVDCDLRRPRVHDFFGLENTIGFTSVLLGKVPLSAAVQTVPSEPRLSVVASGPLPPNPSELLASRRTTEVFTALQALADIVLFDVPPVLPVTDALIVSGQVDTTLLVCRGGSTTCKEASRAAELLKQVDAPLVGTVLNGYKADHADYGYAYKYYGSNAAGRGRQRANGSTKAAAAVEDRSTVTAAETAPHEHADRTSQ